MEKEEKNFHLSSSVQHNYFHSNPASKRRLSEITV